MKIKNKWEDLTFNEVLQIQQIFGADINDTYKISNIIAVLAGVDLEEVENLPIPRFAKLVEEVSFLKDAPVKVEYKDSYEVNGRVYNLCADITSITTAQYIDYQTYMKEETPDLCKITSVFFVPDGHSYNDGNKMEDVWKDVGDMRYVDVEALAFFLRKQFALYTMIIVDSLNREMKKEKVKKKDRNRVLHPLNSMALSLLYSEFAK